MSGKERVGDLSDYKLRRLWESSKQEGSVQFFDIWQARRYQAQTDLFGLCLLLGYSISEKPT